MPFHFAGAQVIIKVSGHQHQWLAGAYWPGNRTFLEVVVTWWIVALVVVFVPLIYNKAQKDKYNNTDVQMT